MAVVSNKTGSTSEPFNVFKQKLGKQTTFKGFKQHFSSITSINQEKTLKTNKTSVVFKEDESIEEKRGFVPSDVLNDPSKREFLTQLSKRMWMEKEKFLSKRRVQFPSLQMKPPFMSQTLYSLYNSIVRHRHECFSSTWADFCVNVFLICILGNWNPSGIRRL